MNSKKATRTRDYYKYNMRVTRDYQQENPRLLLNFLKEKSTADRSWTRQTKNKRKKADK